MVVPGAGGGEEVICRLSVVWDSMDWIPSTQR